MRKYLILIVLGLVPILTWGQNGTNVEEISSLFSFFIQAFLGGTVALLTPCVYPIIPMTVSFFTKQKSGTGLALIYGFSIVAIYVFFGTVIAYFFGQAAPNFFSTHWVPNLIFFLTFIFFGLSFLGWFEITLPSSLVNKMDAQSDKGGLLGVFFMAFTLVLVSFSCTGPIVGTILGLGSKGQWLKPVIGMLGFSLAFAIPFTLFAMFPSWLKSLPKSGGWLNSVKVVLGFLELALAFKFLSTIDLVYNWRILDREVYLAIWIAIFTLMGLYLIGKLRLPHDSKTETISVPRTLFAIVVFTFVVYLIPGMFGAPLKGLAGWLPPLSTFDAFGNSIAGSSTQSGPTGYASGKTLTPEGKEPILGEGLDLPHGLAGFFDLDEAVAYAKKVKKPIFIDFTGKGCVNCRKMEDNVWKDEGVLQRLKEDYVVVALYADIKKELPKDKWFTSNVDGTEINTVGAKNLDFQIDKFKANAQPFYCLIDPKKVAIRENVLAEPVAYNPDVAAFKKFLDEGKSKFKP
jgi:thiol:disulfide interchange protein DsbD